jgi:hypothetical protein
MNAVLALKLSLVPLLIYLVTLAGRRWGPAVAGWLSAFPIVARPILFALTLEQGGESSIVCLLKSMAIPQYCSNPFNPLI